MSELGFVVGRFAIALSRTPVGNGPPNLYPLNGQIEFAPIDVGPMVSDELVTISNEPVVRDLDSNGDVLNSLGLPKGTRGVYLPIGHYWVHIRAQYRNAVKPFPIHVKSAHTESNPLDLTLNQPYYPATGNALVSDRIRAEDAAKVATAEGQWIRDVFVGGTPAVNDAALSTIMETEGTFTEKYLSETFLGKNVGSYVLSKFADLSVTSVNVALNTAISEVPEGSTIIIPPGEYVTSGAIQNNGKSVRIIAEGCRFIQGSQSSFAIFTGSWGTTQTVTSITTVNVTTDTGNVARATRLTLSTNVDWKAGDVVKIFSNNIIAEGRTPSGGRAGRHGEFCTVYSVNGNQVTLSGLLIDTHSLNVRAALLNQKTIEWVGGSYYGSDESFANNWTALVMQIRGLLKPSVKGFRIERASGIGVMFRSNYMPEISDLTVDFLSDRFSPVMQLGYAVIDASNYGLRYTNSKINSVRHAYTDDTSTILEDDSNIEQYGRSYFALGKDVVATGCTSGAFSPHHYGYGHLFINCVANRSFSSGFGMRGSHHQVIDCFIDLCSAGVNAFSEGGGTTKGIKVVNLKSRNVLTHLAAQTNNSEQKEVALEVVGGTYEGGQTFLFASATKVLMTGSPRWIAGASLDNNSGASRVLNSEVVVKGSIEFDYSQNTSGTGLRVMLFSGGSECLFEADSLIVKNRNSASRMNSTLIGTDGSAAQSDTIRILEVVLEVPAGIAAGFNIEESIFSWRTSDYKQNDIFVERLDNQINAGPAPSISRTTRLLTYIKAIAGSNVARTLGTLLPGRYPGQAVIVSWNNPNGGALLTIPNNSNIKTGTGSSRTLAHEQSVMLVWDGVVWRVVS